MALETTLTSKTWNPFDGTTYVNTDQIEFDYSLSLLQVTHISPQVEMYLRYMLMV